MIHNTPKGRQFSHPALECEEQSDCSENTLTFKNTFVGWTLEVDSLPSIPKPLDSILNATKKKK
jgi:hypothetical protein